MADELLQRVRIRAWRGHASYNGSGPYLKWVLAIARREAADMAASVQRWRDRHVPYDPEQDDRPDLDPLGGGMEGAGPAIEITATLLRARRAGILSAAEFQVLAARFSDGGDLGWQAIAPRLGVTPANAATLHMRAVAKLRAYLFVDSPETLGGMEAIRAAFTRLIAAPPAGVAPLTDGEADAFRRAVLAGEARSTVRPVSPALLRAACHKVIRLLPSPL